MSDKPKLIYRYTHAEAVRDGILRVMNPGLGIQKWIWFPIYVAVDLDTELKKLDITDEMLINDITHCNKRTTIITRENFRYDVVPGFEIRDDEKTVPCITLVKEGESS